MGDQPVIAVVIKDIGCQLCSSYGNPSSPNSSWIAVVDNVAPLQVSLVSETYAGFIMPENTFNPNNREIYEKPVAVSCETLLQSPP